MTTPEVPDLLAQLQAAAPRTPGEETADAALAEFDAFLIEWEEDIPSADKRDDLRSALVAYGGRFNVPDHCEAMLWYVHHGTPYTDWCSNDDCTEHDARGMREQWQRSQRIETLRNQLDSGEYDSRPIQAELDELLRAQVTTKVSGYADWDDDEERPAADTLYAASMPLVRSGTLVSIFGDFSRGKSWICALWAAQVVRDGGHVVWLDYEHQRAELRDRLMNTLGLDRDELGRVHYVDGHAEPDLDAIADDVWDWGDLSVLVVIDSFTGLHDVHGGKGNQNDADTVERTQNIARRFQPDATVCLVDHNNREGKIRGSERKMSGVDAAFEVRGVVPFAEGVPGRSELIVAKSRDGRFAIDAKVGVLDYDGERFELQGIDRSPQDRAREVVLGQMRRKLERNPDASDRDLRRAFDGKYRYQLAPGALDELVTEARDAA